MRDQLQERLQELRNEYATGQRKLQEVEAQRMQLSETMLRISGAIQVLEEVLASEEQGQSSEPNTHLPEYQPVP